MTARALFSSWLLMPASLLSSVGAYVALTPGFERDDLMAQLVAVWVPVTCMVVAAIVALCYRSGRRALKMAGATVAWIVGPLAILGFGVTLIDLPFGVLPLFVWWRSAKHPGPWMWRFAVSVVPPVLVLGYISVFPT